jgi:hypothetical protein
MNTSTTRMIVTGLLVLFTLLSGVWLSRSGKPYNTGIFTIHKLIALATVIIGGITIRDLHQVAALVPIIEISAIVITGLLFLALFVSGALLSLDKDLNGLVNVVHKVAPALATLSAAITIYLMIGGRQ